MTGQALATNQPDREDFTRDFQKNLTLPTGQAVRLEHRQGNVTVRTHTERELKLQASIRVSAPDKQEAAQFGNQIQILVDQTAAGCFYSHTVSPGKQRPVLRSPQHLILGKLRPPDASRFSR
jgi:hypothetical protein